MESIRIDKWLWAVRVYKTRGLASEACKTGKIKVNDQEVKPSRDIKPGDIVTIHMGVMTKSLRVVALLKNRVGAKLVAEYAEDLTPEEEYDKARTVQTMNHERWDRGVGRPTKRNRRMIDKLKNELE